MLKDGLLALLMVGILAALLLNLGASLVKNSAFETTSACETERALCAEALQQAEFELEQVNQTLAIREREVASLRRQLTQLKGTRDASE